MKTKTPGIAAPKKHSGSHNDVLKFLSYCIDLGDADPKAAAYRIYEAGWMSPDSKTGSDYKTLELDCVRTWSKAVQQTEAGVTQQKRLKEFEKLRIAREWVDSRVRYDTFLGQYMEGVNLTGPAAEYDAYNSQADDKTFIEKHYFQNAFEVDRMPKVSILKEWAEGLPKWDKKDHVKKLASFIPAKDKKQAELFLKGWLIRSYIQAINPGGQDENSIVNRWFLILYQEKQNSGKSTFFRWLAPDPRWVKGSGLEDNKDGYIALSRYMFILDDELGGLSRVQQHERLKAMISASKIDVRPPYGKVDVSLPRTASFCGSTNNENIFPSAEGTSRFLVLPLEDRDFEWGQYTKQIDKAKLWAQVRDLATEGLWLKDNNENILNNAQETNAHFVAGTAESFVVSEYLQAGDEGTPVVQAGEIMERLTNSYDYRGLALMRLGKELRKAFGPPVSGLTERGFRRWGWRVFWTQSAQSQTQKAVINGKKDGK